MNSTVVDEIRLEASRQCNLAEMNDHIQPAAE